MSSRSLTPILFFGLMGMGIAGAIVAAAVFAWPRGDLEPDDIVIVSALTVPAPGDDPVRVVEGNFWLVNLLPGEGRQGSVGVGGPGGLLALWARDPHLGCTVPWRAEYAFEGVVGNFRNPCHGETYTKAGVRLFGPAPRSLDTFDIRVNRDGSVRVDTARVTLGPEDNALRAVVYGE